jgi:hypothetical protein
MTPSDSNLQRATFSPMSRRAVLTSAAAGASVPVLGGFAGHALSPSAEAATLPLVTPRSSKAAYEAFGVNAMVNHAKSTYQYTGAWMANLRDAGVHYIRGEYAKGSDKTATTAKLARQYGIKWGMTVAPTLAMSDAEIKATIADIAAKAADVCLFIEGINEPNYPRQLGYVPTNWRALTLQKQKVIFQAARSYASLRNVPILSPSLQMNAVTASDYQWFASNGLLNYMTHSATHCYPGGWYPDHQLDERLAPMKKYWPKPVWITETGYTNAVASTSGQKPIPEDIAGIYAPSSILEAVDRGYKTIWFEVLDDPDSGSKNEVEANLGLWGIKSGMAPPWRAKPAALAFKSFLAQLKDPGAAYQPKAIGLRVTSSASDVRWTAIAKRDGSVRLFLRRSKDAWDPVHKVRLNVPSVGVSVTTAKGTRTVSVGSKVVTILL